MPRNPTTGVYTRVTNSFSNPVIGTDINPADADTTFDDFDTGFNSLPHAAVDFVPETNDGAALGTTALKWSDLFLASACVINFNSGDYTVTHSAGLLSFSGDINVAGQTTLQSAITIQSLNAIPAGGIMGAGYKFTSTANFGVFFGSGVPTLSAAKGSLYLRSDGSTINDRMYVNTNGTTGWTAVTTAT